MGARKGRGLQMPQDQAREKVPAAGDGRRLPRAERRGGGQGQPAHPVERPVGPPAEEVPTARQEGEVLKVAGEEGIRERWRERCRRDDTSTGTECEEEKGMDGWMDE